MATPITVHPMAAEVIARAGDYVSDLARLNESGYGRVDDGSTAYSWASAVSRTFELVQDGGQVSRDDEFSLYVVTAYGMHVGVIYRPDGRYRGVMTAPNRALRCLIHNRPATDRNAKGCDHDTVTGTPDVCHVADTPVAGEWSMHS
jgi:hypothetical protein